MSVIVPPTGDPNSTIALVGEAPAKEEVEQGENFVGRTGQVLNDLLVRSRIPRHSCYITNTIKEMVSKSGDNYYIDKEIVYNSKSGFHGKGIQYKNDLIEELKATKANIVALFGNPAIDAILGKRGITKWRGSLVWGKAINKKCIAIIHPAAAFHDYLLRHLILFDLTRLREEMTTKDLVHPNIDFKINPLFSEICNYLEQLMSSKEQIAVDIEVLRGEVSHISFCNSESKAISIVFQKGQTPFFTLPEEAKIWKLIALILTNDKLPKICQKLDFETSFLYEKYGILIKNADDTLIGQKLFLPEFRAGLDFITSIRTRLPFYKDDGKQYMKIGGDPNDFSIYNAKDSWVCKVSFPQIKSDLERIRNYETYEMHRALVEPAVYMSARGLKVDEAGLEKAKIDAQEKVDSLQEELNSIVGAEINTRSSKQVQTYFYIKKGITPYKHKGKNTANEGALKRIARKGYKEARIMLDIRHYANRISKYYSAKLKDGRLKCSYSPVTAMGRLSSSEDIFGFGTNMQNQPYDMNQFFMADPGCLLYNVDLQQADNRSVAYIAPEPRMIKAFEDNADVHSLTASIIFNIPVDEIIQMDKEKIFCEIGYGDHTHRFWGKQTNHSLNFGRGYKDFAYSYEIPEKQGMILWNKYHQTYPGVRNGYWQGIQNTLRTNNRILQNCFGRKFLFKQRWGDKLFKTAYAFPAQSNTADIINRWGVLPIYYDDKFKDLDLLRQVHDSVEFQVPLSRGIDRHIEIIKDLRKSLERTLKWKVQEWIIPIDVEVGFRRDPMKKLNLDGNLKEQLKEFWNDNI